MTDINLPDASTTCVKITFFHSSVATKKKKKTYHDAKSTPSGGMRGRRRQNRQPGLITTVALNNLVMDMSFSLHARTRGHPCALSSLPLKWNEGVGRNS